MRKVFLLAAMLSLLLAAQYAVWRSHSGLIVSTGAAAGTSLGRCLTGALGVSQPAGTVTPGSWVWTAVALVGGLGTVLVMGAILAPREERRLDRKASQLGFSVATVALAVAALTAVILVSFVRLPWYGLAAADYVLPYFLGMAGVLFALRLLWPEDFAVPITESQDLPAISALRGLAVFATFLGGIGMVVQEDLNHYALSGLRVVPFTGLAIGIWLYLVQEEGLKRAVGHTWGEVIGLLVGVVAKLIIVVTWVAQVALPSPQPLLPMVAPAALAVLVLLELVSFVLSRWRYSAVGIAAFHALVLAFTMSALFPLN